MKYKTIPLMIVMFLITMTSALAIEICEERMNVGDNCTMLTPSINCSAYNYTIYNTTNLVRSGNLTQLNGSIYYFIFNETTGDYLVELCDGSTREIRVEGEDMSGGISITLFILIATAIFGLLPFYTRFSKSEIANLVLRRGSWLIAIFLMILNSGIMATIAENAGIPLTQEMFMFMTIFGWGGYLFMAYFVIKTLFDVLATYKQQKHQARYGDDF